VVLSAVQHVVHSLKIIDVTKLSTDMKPLTLPCIDTHDGKVKFVVNVKKPAGAFPFPTKAESG